MNLNHANIAIGKEGKNFVTHILENDLNFKISGNPDFINFEAETFGIDDARDLIKWSIGKPLLGEIKVAFIEVSLITLEAQNSLLKVLEEPPLGTYIFINLINLGDLLPTFLSRVFILNPDDDKEELKNKDALDFLRSNIKDRLTFIRSFINKEDKSKIKDFLFELETFSHQNRNDIRSTNQIKKIIKAKVFASARGSSPKMLLEWLSCDIIKKQ